MVVFFGAEHFIQGTESTPSIGKVPCGSRGCVVMSTPQSLFEDSTPVFLAVSWVKKFGRFWFRGFWGPFQGIGVRGSSN